MPYASSALIIIYILIITSSIVNISDRSSPTQYDVKFTRSSSMSPAKLDFNCVEPQFEIKTLKEIHDHIAADSYVCINISLISNSNISTKYKSMHVI